MKTKKKDMLLGNLLNSLTTETKQRDSDFRLSVVLLSQGHVAWHKLQSRGLVTWSALEAPLSTETINANANANAKTLTLWYKNGLEIAEGRYARVYMKDNKAYKVIRVKKDCVEELRCNLKELCFLHSLEHPCLMHALRSQVLMEHGDFHKIVHEMDFAPLTLQNLIERDQILSFRQLQHLFAGVLSGLHHLHGQGIIHGDVKPANVMLEDLQTPKLGDFTLTTYEHKGHEVPFGTLFWRSPECLTHQHISFPSDVWSFSLMILDALYGKTYTDQVLGVDSDETLLCFLVYLIGPPPPHLGLILPEVKVEALEEVRAAHKIQIPLTEAELSIIYDLFSKTLLWEPEKRLTTSELLQHGFFRDVTPFEMKKTREKPEWRWESRQEKQAMTQSLKYAYFRLFSNSMDDYFLHDCLILMKRLIVALQERKASFLTSEVAQAVCQFEAFFWKCSVFPDDDLFFASVFHILHLLDFRIFAAHEEQEQPQMQPLLSPQEERQKDQPQEQPGELKELPPQAPPKESPPKTPPSERDASWDVLEAFSPTHILHDRLKDLFVGHDPTVE